MTDLPLPRFETAYKHMNEIVNPSWHRELVKRLELEVRLGTSVLDRLEQSVQLQHQLKMKHSIAEKAAQDLANVVRIPAVIELERQIQQILQSVSLPDVKVPGSYFALNNVLLHEAKVLKSVEALVRRATHISQPGGLTNAIGPKASAAAGIKRYTVADAQGATHLREDVALGFVEEAKTAFLAEPENLRQASSLELVDDDLTELEAFLLPTPASQAAFEAATRELVFEPLNEVDHLGARAAVLVSIFLLLMTLCLSGQTDKPIDAGDYVEAAANAAGVTLAIGSADVYMSRRRDKLQKGTTDSGTGQVDGGLRPEAPN